MTGKHLEAILDRLQETFPETFWATDEDGEVIDITDDPYLKMLVERGEIFEAKEGQVCDNPPGQCHESVAWIWRNERCEGDKLYTGFALNIHADEWFTHSFIVNEGTVIEPGSTLFRGYIGVELTGKDLDQFLEVWGSAPRPDYSGESTCGM